MVKNLITGIGGFVASHLADLLLEKGEEVIGTYRWNEDLSRIEHIKDKITLVPMNLLDFKSCQDCIMEFQPDYIFHLAAESYVTDSFKIPKVTIETNTIGTLNLLEAIRTVRDLKHELVEQIVKDPRQIHFLKDFTKYDPVIHVCSSSEVYGLVKEEDVPIKESQPFNPCNPYAVGKVGADMLGLMYFTNYGLKIIRTRMFTHTGPRRTMMSAECNFAKQIAKIEKYFEPAIKDMDLKDWEIKDDKYVLKHGNLDSIRTWADVRDAVKAYWLLVRKGKPGEVYNIGGDSTCKVGDMLNYLINLSPIKDKIIKEQDPKLMRPHDVTLQIPDCSKFKKLGWKPEFPFQKTMIDLLNWWRENV
jgi:GDP-D-mannose dehydratase